MSRNHIIMSIHSVLFKWKHMFHLSLHADHDCAIKCWGWDEFYKNHRDIIKHITDRLVTIDYSLSKKHAAIDVDSPVIAPDTKIIDKMCYPGDKVIKWFQMNGEMGAITQFGTVILKSETEMKIAKFGNAMYRNGFKILIKILKSKCNAEKIIMMLDDFDALGRQLDTL